MKSRVSRRAWVTLAAAAVLLPYGVVSVVRLVSLKEPWFEGPKLELQSGLIGDVRVDGRSVFALGDQSGSEFVLVEEFSQNRKATRVAQVPAKLRDWRDSPKRPDLLLRSGSFLVFYGESFDKVPLGKKGMVVVDSTFAYGFAPIGTVEELAEAGNRVVVEVVNPGNQSLRDLYWFTPSTRAYEPIPAADPNQDIRSLVPTKDGGFLAYVQINSSAEWYRFKDRKWSRLGRTDATLTRTLLSDWSGGRGTVYFPDQTIGDVRQVSGAPWLTHYARPVSSQPVGAKPVKGRVVFADLIGQLITTDEQLGYVRVANGHP